MNPSKEELELMRRQHLEEAELNSEMTGTEFMPKLEESTVLEELEEIRVSENIDEEKPIDEKLEGKKEKKAQPKIKKVFVQNSDLQKSDIEGLRRTIECHAGSMNLLTQELVKTQNRMAEVVCSLSNMTKNMLEIASKNLEAEKIKLRILEVKNKPNFGMSVVSEPLSVEKNNIEQNFNNLDILEENNVLKINNLEDNSLSKITIKRDYKLTQKTHLNVWLDFLTSDLKSNDLIDVIEGNTNLSNLPKSILEKKKNLVRDIIINHLDENYHRRILHLNDPKEILEKLKLFKKSELNITDTALRTQLYKLRIRKSEKVEEFIERFDSICREYDMCSNATPLIEKEIRAAFYQAIVAIYPEIRSADMYKRLEGSEMNLEQIKTYMFQLEAEKKSEAGAAAAPVANRAAAPATKCYRCSNLGHVANECPLRAKNLWFCYYCQAVRNHKGLDCPTQKTRGNNNNKYFYNSNFKGVAHNTIGQKEKINRVDVRGKINKNKNHNNKNKLRWVAGQQQQQQKSTNKQGKSDSIIKFIADSGATDHIVNKTLILSDVRDCKNTFIKSANKNNFADISIDGKENLNLETNDPKRNKIQLTGVFAAKDVSENLLSLRRLADAGLGIYLDDSTLRVTDRETNKIILEGSYEKPNWLITFRVKKSAEIGDINKEGYCCRAAIYSDDELPEQLQQRNSNMILKNTEGGEKCLKENAAAIGREEERLIEEEELENSPEKNNLEENNKISEWDFGCINRRTTNLDDENSISEIEKLLSKDNLERTDENNKTYSEGMLWHIRLGHASLRYLQKLKKTEKALEKVKFEDSISDCETCAITRIEKLKFKETRVRAQRPLQVIHTDIMGPIKPASYPSQKKFIIVFVDDYTRLAKAYALKTKDEAGDALEEFIKSARNLRGIDEKICYIKSDQGTEFTSKKFKEVLDKEGAELILAPPYTPEHNGTSERFNRTIQKIIRALMFDSGLPRTMWELAVDAAIHIYNRTPHKTLEFESPLILFATNIKEHFDKLKRFGCIAYVKIPKADTKFEVRAIKTVLVGYKPTGYLLWHPSSRRFIESRNIRLNEKLVYKDVYAKNSEIKNDWNWLEKSDENMSEEKLEEKLEAKTENKEGSVKRKRGRPKKIKKKEFEEQTKLDEKEKEFTRESRETRSSTKRKIEEIKEKKVRPVIDISFARYIKTEENNTLDEETMRQISIAELNHNPVTYEEAVTQDVRWLEAIKDELESMKNNNVWTLVDKPKVNENNEKPNIIDSKWVFKRKIESNNVTRYKARLVIRGFKDKNNYDLKDTYAPVSSLTVVRAALAIINKYDLDVVQMDVKTAFLNGELEEEIYMTIPKGLEVDENTKRTKVCKLKKSLYGLKISPKRWNQRFSTEMKKLELENDLHEPCLFTWRKDGKLILVILYVDDLLIAGNDKEKLEVIIRSLKQTFDMKDLGEPKNFLGINIERFRRERIIKLNQEMYTRSVLEKFNMNECKQHDTPMITRQASNKKRKLDENIDERNVNKELKTVPYREAIGSLMYLANATRPDIAFAVNYLARRQMNPTEEDWLEVIG